MGPVRQRKNDKIHLPVSMNKSLGMYCRCELIGKLKENENGDMSLVYILFVLKVNMRRASKAKLL